MNKKINFSNIKIYTNISKTKFETLDIKTELADLIYNRSTGISFHSLALKIYNSIDFLILTEKEVELLKSFSNEHLTPAVIDAINENLLEVKD